MNLAWKEAVGKVLKPVLESTALDRVKYVPGVRRFARDWAVAFGLWDDGLLEKEQKLGPIDIAQASAWAKGRRQGSLTLYVDPSEPLTERMTALLGEIGATFKLVDISDDAASRKWLADECNGARPPQLFLDGERLGGLEDIRKLHAEGKLQPLVFRDGGVK
jgi:glutaredoxin